MTCRDDNGLFDCVHKFGAPLPPNRGECALLSDDSIPG
jgi:hypothetical protein